MPLNNIERPQTLKALALKKLREAIMLGEFSPGERLVERNLCQQLGVSRTVVRECIRHLESERLVKVVPNSGPSIAVLKSTEIREIYEIRMHLECMAIESCALKAGEETISQLRQHLTFISAALKEANILQALEYTRLFYQTIFLAGDKLVAWDLVEQLNGRIGRLRVLTLTSEGREVKGPENLQRIVKAIERQDADEAARACKVHLSEALGLALEA